MKKHLLWIALAATLAGPTASFAIAVTGPIRLAPSPQQSGVAHLASEVVSRFHYKALPLDAAMSGKIFNQYLKSLDGEKMYFVQADIDAMSSQRTILGAAILRENLAGPFAMFNLYTQRASERFAYARSIIKGGFDFSTQETFQPERENAAWPASKAELNTLWRKHVKNDWLRLKLAGESDQRIAETLTKRYETAQNDVKRVTTTEAFETFMNAYTMAIDPHSNYMGPRSAQEFDIAMSLSLVGIGATMSQKDGYNTVRDLVPGGPAMRSGKLEVGDRIVGVAQGTGSPMVSVQGWRLNDTIQLIRGSADTTVVLDILPADAASDGARRQISLVRKKIELEDGAAKKTMLSVVDGKVTRQIGVISLPTFYRDFEAQQRGDQNYRSMTRDVAKLLGELKTAKADGVLIDLRNNGGGSLAEAIGLTGLFTGKGPVLQQRDAKGQIVVDSETSAGAAWDGPVGVLINRGSASASEIFAAAIQDYGRGVVIGERSFGKGTVQSTINLDDLLKRSKPMLGELKMTTAQFFRINGSTTQLRGVNPDVSFPTDFGTDDRGEAAFDNALPWVQIKPASYAASGQLKSVIPMLVTRSGTRIKADTGFRNIEEDIARFVAQKKKNDISLNETVRRKEREEQKARLTARQAVNIGSVSPGVAPAKPRTWLDDGLQADERDLAVELAAGKAKKDAKDILLQEAAHVVSDQAGLLDEQKVNAEAAVPKKPMAAKPAGHETLPAGSGT
ncbi:carboxy terminal-processing peptidase [Actimicrobium antarcticum]|uniref:Carboxy terminal-processing peptidase n=1 Tax=Actimicrobium antarcticum TaxID=1051899 RepID=A0ABP7SW42_9BURK